MCTEPILHEEPGGCYKVTVNESETMTKGIEADILRFRFPAGPNPGRS